MKSVCGECKIRSRRVSKSFYDTLSVCQSFDSVLKNQVIVYFRVILIGSKSHVTLQFADSALVIKIIDVIRKMVQVLHIIVVLRMNKLVNSKV